jgi:hypothetical protein
MTDEAIRARVDRDGRLISADAAMAHLQQRAGGKLPGPIVVPQLAVIVATALRLNAPMLRPVYAGEADFDLRFWVRVVPDGDGAALTLSGWSEEAKVRPQPGQDTAFPLDGPGWTFECDRRLAILGLWAEGSAARIRTRDWIGKTLDELFEPVGADTIAAILARGESIDSLAVDALIDGVVARAELNARPSLTADGTLSGASGSLMLKRGKRSETPDKAPYLPGNWGALDRRMDEALRLPIGRIIANAETIARRIDGAIADDYASYAGDIASAGKHLLGLIDDLADLQAIERSGFEVARERVDLSKVAAQAAGLLSMRAAEKSMAIKVEPGDRQVLAVGEFRRVLQILINFLGNAVRYAPDNTTITIETALDSDSDRARVTVIDQGPGIPAEDQKRIFDKFERLGRRDHGGSGLGLYISNRLARAMDGSVAIDSAPGEGARFTLSLPRWSE